MFLMRVGLTMEKFGVWQLLKNTPAGKHVYVDWHYRCQNPKLCGV